MKKESKVFRNNVVAFSTHFLSSFVIYMVSSLLVNIVPSDLYAEMIMGLLTILMLVVYYLLGRFALQNTMSKWGNVNSVLILPILGVVLFSHSVAYLAVFFYGFLSPLVLLLDKLHHAIPFILLESPVPFRVVLALCVYSFIPALLLYWGMRTSKRNA